MKQEASAYRHRLVALLEEQGCQITGKVRKAFTTIPRHLFIPSYYQRLASPSGREWKRIDATESQEWYKRIYSLNSLVTHINEDGIPMSSSSDPAIMAPMLEYLDVQPGHRVLEIGTGTGYNACLLAALTADPHTVTTIDIDADLIAQATMRIEQVVGPGMHVLVADDTSGCQEHAPYDRIIVTVASPIVPSAWYEQLVPGGILVCVLKPSRSGAGGVLRAIKRDTHLQGQILCGASFMPMNNTDERRSVLISLLRSCKEHFQGSPAYFNLDLLDDVDFHFYWSFLFPQHARMFQTVKGRKRTYTLLTTDTTLAGYVSYAGSTITLHGPYGSLHWQRLLQAFMMWHTMKQPRIEDYAFCMDGKSQRLFIQKEGNVFYPFARAFQCTR
jgi:protein-L-isoaspartate(D-aspartate) O-methyltransferase